MIRVNDYTEVSFIRFIENRNLETNTEKSEERAIEEYLYENCKQWDVKLFLKLFQDFLILNEELSEPLSNKFEKFVSSSDSLEYIIPSSIDKQPWLHGFILNFLRSLKESISYKEMNDFFIHSAITTYEMNTGLEEWFKSVIERYGSTLFQAFVSYSSNTFYHNHYHEFGTWLRSTSQKFQDMPPVDVNHHFSFNERRIRLSFLIASPPIKKVHPLMVATNELASRDYEFEYIDFLRHLESRRINLAKTITYPIMMEYIEDYCSKFGRPMAPLKRFAKSINKKDSLFKKVIRLMQASPRGIQFSLERLGLTKAHGLILFPKHLNLSKFLQVYWEDIHFMTQDFLDIYYTEEDFKTNVSGYKRIRNFSEFNNKEVTLPALFVWKNFGTEVHLIELKGLEHQEVYQIIEFFKIEIAKETDFLKAVENTKQEILTINERKKNMEKYNVTVNGNGPVTVGENSKTEIGKIEYQIGTPQAINKDQLMIELAAIEEHLKTLDHKNNEQKILLSDIMDTRNQAKELTTEGIIKRLIPIGSSLLYNTATGVNAGIIANIISKAIGL